MRQRYWEGHSAVSGSTRNARDVRLLVVAEAHEGVLALVVAEEPIEHTLESRLQREARFDQPHVVRVSSIGALGGALYVRKWRIHFPLWQEVVGALCPTVFLVAPLRKSSFWKAYIFVFCAPHPKKNQKKRKRTKKKRKKNGIGTRRRSRFDGDDKLVVFTEVRVGRRFDRTAIVDDVRFFVRGHPTRDAEWRFAWPSGHIEHFERACAARNNAAPSSGKRLRARAFIQARRTRTGDRA